QTPFRPGEEARLYLSDRQRAPALIHLLTGLEAAGVHPGSIRLRVLPTLVDPTESPSTDPAEAADALRGALLGMGRSPRVGPTLQDLRRHQARRLRKFWAVAGRFLVIAQDAGFRPDSGPVVNRVTDLLPEDRGFLSIYEGLRREVLSLYEAGDVRSAAQLLNAFFDRDLRGGYLVLADRRLGAAALPPEKLAVLRVLWHVLTTWTELLGPIAPSTSEAVHRALRGDTESLFQRRFSPIQEGLKDPKLEASYRRWRALDRVIARGRRRLAIPSDRPLPVVVLSVREEPLAEELRSEESILRRLLGAE
ncbi:MAG: class I tRNA ligase family protein, partial [Thermoplasmata archaeon]|nr:class I tRNA ligase family protein [Thermoplasmata archaeon]